MRQYESILAGYAGMRPAFTAPPRIFLRRSIALCRFQKIFRITAADAAEHSSNGKVQELQSQAGRDKPAPGKQRQKTPSRHTNDAVVATLVGSAKHNVLCVADDPGLGDLASDLRARPVASAGQAGRQ
jgi:hypothetical protein